MRIAQVAPLWEAVPPRTYGGIELVVHLLCEALVRRGHNVTLFATANSQTAAKLEPMSERGLRELIADQRADRSTALVLAYELRMLGQVFARADEFDIIHNHIGFQSLPFAGFVRTPIATTLHNALDPAPVRALYDQYSHLAYISISNFQQQLWPELNYVRTIYHGIETEKFDPRFDVADDAYLVFLGRLYPEKGAHLAVQIARAVGRRIILAGKVDEAAQQYYNEVMVPLIDGQQVTYIGEVDHEQKVDLMRNAAATLCPIQWPEPFGLVLIESLACGTPVLALRDGSIPEILDHGRTGFIGDSVSDLINDFARLGEIDRRACRREVEQRFSVERMLSDHEQLYQQLVSAATTATTEPGHAPPVPPPRGKIPATTSPQRAGLRSGVNPADKHRP